MRFRDGLPAGKGLEYGPDGKVSAEIAFGKDGRYTRREYYPNRRLAKEAEMLNDQPDGITRLYSEDGKLTHEMTYAGGRKNGPAKYFGPDGSLKETVMFKNDSPAERTSPAEDSGKTPERSVRQ